MARAKRPEFTTHQQSQFRDMLVEAGEKLPEKAPFREWVKARAERDLWFFSRYILNNDWLGMGSFHRRVVVPFLTDFSKNRFKLLMLPMGHLKTTIVSRSIPLHLMIQPAKSNIYLPGRVGANCRVLLAQESEDKSKENLQVSKENAESNDVLYWLWPEVFWADKKEAPRWLDNMLQFKRKTAWAEASITSIGIETGFVGRYYDMIIADDLVTNKASESPKLLQRAKNFRKAAKTRLTDKVMGIFMGVGTEWPGVDFYSEWQGDAHTEIMVRSIEEEDPVTKELVPLWPEKYSPEIIAKLRTDYDPTTFAAWYMNRQVGRGISSLDWSMVREYSVISNEKGTQLLEYVEAPETDRYIKDRRERINQNLGFVVRTRSYDPSLAKQRKPPKAGADDFERYEFFAQKYIDEEGVNHLNHLVPKPAI